jgi:hypothetical protein
MRSAKIDASATLARISAADIRLGSLIGRVGARRAARRAAQPLRNDALAHAGSAWL